MVKGPSLIKNILSVRKKGNKVNRYNCWRISMEIAMTDESVLIWLTDVLGCGTLNKKPRKNGTRCNTDGVVYFVMPFTSVV